MPEQTTLPPAAEPGEGIHQLTDDEYFAPELGRATLSSTGARELLKPGGPARFKHRQDAGTVEVKREYDLGHAVHTYVLGSGPVPVVIAGDGKGGPDAWTTNAVKEKVAAARAAGQVPLRPKDHAAAQAMAAAVAAHPIAAMLLRVGEPERTLIWRDQATGVLCRAKADWLRPTGIVDLKTAEAADAEALGKASYNHGYAVQAPFYLRGFRAVRPGVVPFFSFIAVEKEPPYLVHVTQLTQRALDWGDQQVSRALEIYRDSTASGVWLGYPTDEITDIDLPSWVRTEEW